MISLYRIFTLLALTVALGAAVQAQSSVQLWYQKSGGNLGAVMQTIVDPQGRIFASVYHAGIYRSLDTGKSWQQVAPYTDGVWSMGVRSSGELIAALWSRGIFRSTDHGTVWQPMTDPKLNADVRAVSANGTIFIEAAGRSYRSSPLDTAWIELPVHGGAMTAAGNTMIAVKGKECSRSTDGGAQWMAMPDAPAPLYAVAADSLGAVFAGAYVDDAAPASSIYSFSSASNSWNGNGPPSTINAIVRRRDGVLFAASHDSGFYFSTSGGASWKQYNTGLSSPKIFSLTLLNDTTIVAGTTDGVFFSAGPLASLLPVELTSFTASVHGSTVHVRWTTATEVNNHGFTVQRRQYTGFPQNGSVPGHWEDAGFVEGGGTTNAPRDYLFVDRTVRNGVTEYRLKQTDRDGTVTYHPGVLLSVQLHPDAFALLPNYPNPFNPSTIIPFTLARDGRVTLTISDLLGRRAVVLLDEHRSAGDHSIRFDAGGLSAGVYLCTLRFGSHALTRPMLLVR